MRMASLVDIRGPPYPFRLVCTTKSAWTGFDAVFVVEMA